MKQFDEKFRQQTKDAFSGYNADRLADAGWNAFLRKRKRRGIAGIIIPMWAKAASVAILLTTGSLITYRLLDIAPGSVSEYVVVAEETKPVGDGTAEPKVENIARESVAGESFGESVKVETVTSSLVAEGEAGTRSLVVKSEDVAAPLVAKSEKEVAGEAPKAVSVNADTTTRRVEEKLAVRDPVVEPAAVVVAEPLEEIAMEDPVIDLNDDPEQRTRKTFLMAGLSGMMSGSDEVSSGVPGFSFGVYGEHKLSRRWAVRPGVVLAMQSVGLGSPTAEKSMSYLAPALDGASGNVESFEGSLHMLAMEVPVNLVYTIIERGERGLYVSAGASTMVYLNQDVSGSFTNSYTQESYNSTTGEFSSETRYSSVSVDSSEEPFSHTDFFGLANFSAGYTMPFGKSSRLLIEPYVQLPVNTLTSLNLRIRYGGVSMKIRFGK